MLNKSFLDKPNGGYAADIADAITKKHTQGTDTSLGTQTEALDMGNYQINNLAYPVALGDAVNLDTLQKSILNVTSLVLPFYNESGALDTIPLTADSKVPFYVSTGAASNIPLTT